jgi:hypothetical protein
MVSLGYACGVAPDNLVVLLNEPSLNTRSRPFITTGKRDKRVDY